MLLIAVLLISTFLSETVSQYAGGAAFPSPQLSSLGGGGYQSVQRQPSYALAPQVPSGYGQQQQGFSSGFGVQQQQGYGNQGIWGNGFNNFGSIPSNCGGGISAISGIPSFDVASNTGNYGVAPPAPPNPGSYAGGPGGIGFPGLIGGGPGGVVPGAPLVYSASAYGPILPNVDFGCCFVRYTDTEVLNYKLALLKTIVGATEFEVCLHGCLAAAATFNAGDCVAIQYTPKTRLCELYKQTGRDAQFKFNMKYGIDYLEKTNAPGCALTEPVMALMTSAATAPPPVSPSTVTQTTRSPAGSTASQGSTASTPPRASTSATTKSPSVTTQKSTTKGPVQGSTTKNPSQTTKPGVTTKSPTASTTPGSNDDLSKKCPGGKLDRIPNMLPPVPGDPAALTGISAGSEADCVQACLDAKDFKCLSVAYFFESGEDQNCLLSGASKVTDPGGLSDSGDQKTEYIGLDTCKGGAAAVLDNNEAENEPIAESSLSDAGESPAADEQSEQVLQLLAKRLLAGNKNKSKMSKMLKKKKKMPSKSESGDADNEANSELTTTEEPLRVVRRKRSLKERKIVRMPTE